MNTQYLDGDIERLEALRDAVKHTSRKRMRDKMIDAMLKGNNIKQRTAEIYVGNILKYRSQFEEALAEAVAFEKDLEEKLDSMFKPVIKQPRPKKKV